MGQWSVVIHGVGSHDVAGGIEDDVAEFVKAEEAKGQRITHVVVAGSAVHEANRHEHGHSGRGRFAWGASYPGGVGPILRDPQ